MFKTTKRVVLGSVSALLLGTLIWVLFLLNPAWSYAHQTHFGPITVHHNQVLEAATDHVLKEAIEIIKTSALYTPDFQVDLCMNDGSRFPEFHPFSGGLAYAFVDKAVFYNAQPDFARNRAFNTAAGPNQVHKESNLTWLLAHEFTHNLQFNWNILFPLKYEFWQQEGYAEYISRQWKNDGLLREKIKTLLDQESKKQGNYPIVFLNPDGTTQELSYYKYGLMVQYLFEQEGLDFVSLADEKRSFEAVYLKMMAWSELVKD
ncbi:MAG: hypothetical protein Sapg2KO_11790 [Saprospiraceae bacterium]